MVIEVLRLNHRIGRDARVSTHVALTARALCSSKIYYSGQKDNNMEKSINKITEKFGGPFEIEYLEDPKSLLEQKKKQGFLIAHLTMYGKDFISSKNNIKNRNLLIIVGGEKVEYDFYNIADFNFSVTNQPISEVSALGIFLYEIFGYKENFKNAKLQVVGMKKGKLLKQL
ncbi:tRNA (cytidine(56)-2'-O)-methyltransferase [Candidatus Woesearchaeota archaeon]|nr:tRNA (cytidine(56)-2'-O)-methyltransferase [Candidatus Woesearchaeota archaeon]